MTLNRSMSGIGRHELLAAPLGHQTAITKFVFLEHRMSRAISKLGVSAYSPGDVEREIRGRAYSNHIADLISTGLYAYDESSKELLDVGYLSVNPVKPSEAEQLLASVVSNKLKTIIQANFAKPQVERANVMLLPTNFVVAYKERKKATPEQVLVIAVLFMSANFSGVIDDIDTADIGLAASIPASIVEVEIDWLARNKIVIRDKKTGELFLVDWFAFGRFVGDRGKGAARCATKVRSKKIRDAVLTRMPPHLHALADEDHRAGLCSKKQIVTDQPSRAKESYNQQSKSGDGAAQLESAATSPLAFISSSNEAFASLSESVRNEILRLKYKVLARPTSRLYEDADRLKAIIRVVNMMPTARAVSVLENSVWPSDAVPALDAELLAFKREEEQRQKHTEQEKRQSAAHNELEDAQHEIKSIEHIFSSMSDDEKVAWESSFESALAPHETTFWRKGGHKSPPLRKRVLSSLLQYSGEAGRKASCGQIIDGQ